MKATSATGAEGYPPILPLPVCIHCLLSGQLTRSDLTLYDEIRRWLNEKQWLS